MNRDLQMIGIIVAIAGTILTVVVHEGFIVIALIGAVIFSAGRIGAIKP